MFTKLAGTYDLSKIFVIQTHSRYQPPHGLADRIESIWEAACRQYGKRLWNGVNYRLDKIVPQEDTLTLYVGTAEYKVNYASKALASDVLQLPFEDRFNCMNVSTLIETSDHKFVLGRTHSDSIHGTTFALFGGSLNQDEQEIVSGEDFARYLYKEIQEELCLSETYITHSILLGIYETPTLRTALYFYTQLSLDSSSLEQKLAINDEHEGYEILSREELLALSDSGKANAGVFLALSLLHR